MHLAPLCRKLTTATSRSLASESKKGGALEVPAVAEGKFGRIVEAATGLEAGCLKIQYDDGSTNKDDYKGFVSVLATDVFLLEWASDEWCVRRIEHMEASVIGGTSSTFIFMPLFV